MKVIKLGEKAPVNTWPRQFTCNKCKSVLELDAEDVDGFYDQRDGDTGFFNCSVCNQRNYIGVSHWRDAKTALQNPPWNRSNNG